MYLYKTYALFTEEKHFNVINGTVQDPGDIYFAYYVDNTITREMPKKGTGYTLDTEKSNCTNGVVPKWDNSGWQFIGDYSGYNATDYTRTRCDLYFKKIDITAVDYIKGLAKYDTETIATDEAGGNIRYIGKDPDNYVNIDGDIWRIIGVMKDIDDGNGNKSDRIKLIRAVSIGTFSWDTSSSTVNSGYGVNEWSQADLMKLLNSDYTGIGGSLYWNKSSGTCYMGKSNATKTCYFTSTGIKDKLKALISDAVWNTGSQGTNSSILAKDFYSHERSDNTGKICSSGSYCNDDLARTTTWTGKVALMYPSDYGYATSGGRTTDRATCLNTNLYNWNSSSVSDCKNNDWLYLSGYQWTLMPCASLSSANAAFALSSAGAEIANEAYYSLMVRPVVYLLPSVGILSGDGSKTNPFILE